MYTNPNPNNSDYLYIFDGDSPDANSMGSYTGNTLSGIPVTGTVNNVTGCLTFVFQPSNSSAGTFPGWEALISCTTPCDPPTAASTIVDPVPDLENSVSVCLNTPISFQDAGSVAAPGFTIENYIWNFDDGSIEEGPNLTEVTHAFSEPGEYIVTLTVVDNNGCQNLNLVPLQVLVSTIPIFYTDFSPEICLGGTGYVDGSPVQSQTWTALPPQVVAGETFLADGAGFSYESSLSFDFFDDDQELESCDDLYGISINMEHSYMGDLDILITCPDGTSVFLFEQAGGGTFLGEAVDDGSIDPGVGYDYIWSPTATNGTWGANSGTANILPAGTYESNEDMCQLVGCPLNGDWTIEVIDNLAIDNGYIFEWGIDLNPALFPGITTFTPEIGLGLDSTWVEGDFFTSVSDDGNYSEITPPALGEYEYTFFASNNFNCTFDTTIVVEVVNGPVVDAGMDLQICNDPLELDASILSNDFEAEPCVFILELTNEGGFGFNNSGVDVLFDGVFSESFTSTAFLQEFEIAVPSGSTMTLEYVFSTWGEGTGNIVTLYNDLGEEIFQSENSPSQGVIFDEMVLCLGDGQLQWEWIPDTGLSNPFIPNPVVDISQSIDYTVNVFPQGFEGCLTTDVVSVTVDPAGDPGTDSTLVLCYNYGTFNLIDMLGGNPVASGEWTDGTGAIVAGSFNTTSDLGDTFTYTVENNGCTNSAVVDITVIPQGDPICCEFDYSTSQTNTLCNASADGTFTINMFSSTEGGPWVIDLDSGTDVVTQNTGNTALFTDLLAGTYTVSITDAGLCFTTFTIEILEPAVIPISTVADSTICLTGAAMLEAWSSSDFNNDYIFTWIDLGDGNQSVSPDVETTYSVYATTPDGCESPTEDVVISLYDPLSVVVSNDTLVCQNQDVTLSMLSESGGTGGFNYNWSLNGNALSTSESIDINLALSATYCLTLTDGCETPFTQECVFVEVEETPVLSMFSTNPSGCEPFTISFENQTDANLFSTTYWDIEEASFNETDSFDYEFLVPGIYDVTMAVQSDLGCDYSAEYPNYVTIYQSPEPAFTWDPFYAIVPETELDFMNLTEEFIVDYYWVFDTINILGTSTLENPVFEFPITQGGDYYTSLTVTDLNGCVASQTNLITIGDPLNIYVPSAFTPDNDGLNDIFEIKGTDINKDRFQIWVYNRWGEQVYYSEDMDAYWDGSVNGGDYYVSPSTYTYRVVYYSISTTQRYEKHGHLTVIR